MKQTLIFLIALSFLWSSSADNDFTAKFENKSVYGLWLDLDSGKNIEINSKTNFSFERLDHDLIVIQKKGKKSYLKRIGALLTELSGRIVLSTSDKKYLPARNITLTVVNIKDPSIKAKIRTNNNGYFTNKSLPSGYYTILSSTQKRSFKAKIELKKRKEALGTFVLKSKSQTNFKSQLHLPGSYIISNKKHHKAKVEIINYGDTRGTVCFKASMRDPNLRSLNFKASCKTLKPNGSVIMPLSISFNPINADKLSKVLDIQLTDNKGVQHVQPHPFTVYKEHFTLKLDTALKTLNTYIVLPNQEIKKITPSKKGVVLPKQSNANYQLIIANTDPRYPTKYEADIGAAQTLRVGYKKTISKKEAKDIQIFRLQQTISRYPNQGDIGIYNFKVAQTITLNEDAKTHRIPFYQRNHLGDQIHYKVTMSNQKLATVSYKNGFITIKPKPNAHGIASLILKNKDGSTYGNNIKHFTLEVRSINDKPKFTSRPITSIIEGDNYRYFVKGEDIESTHLTKSAITLPAWLKFSQKKGLLYGKAQAKHVGTHKVRLALKDEKDTIYQTFTIKVHAKKRSALPTFATFSTNEDTPLQARIARKVPDEAVEIYMINKKPSNGRVLVKTDGTFIYKPDKDFNGNDTFSVTHNVNGKIKVLLISIDITSVNDIPTAKDIIINPVGIQKLTLDWAKLSQAADIDEDDLFVKIKSKTALGEIVLVNDTILYTPYPNKQGSEKVLLEVSDKQGGVVLIWLYLYNIERSITPKVLKTGQSIIYHAHDDGVYKKSISKEYEKDLKGKVIKDMITLTTWYPEKKAQARTYEEAKEFCEDLEVENVSNWHLPKIEELVLLTDKGHIAPAIDPIFDAMRNDYYWSKSLYKERDNNRWVLNFDQGEDYYRHEAKTAFTLCAHKGIDDLHPPLPVNLNDSNRTYVISTETNASSISRDTNTTFSYFTRDSKKGTVTDKKSELMWQDRKLGPIATWTSAIDRCENLNFAGYKDWRVPNFNELYRITAHDLNKTATNEAFKAIKEASFWSTTSSENDHDRAWGISFIKGNDFTYDKTEQLYSRCVRDLK